MDQDLPSDGLIPAGTLPPELVEGFLNLCAGNFSVRLPRNYQRDERDTLAFFFNATAEEVERLVRTSRDQEQRLTTAVEHLTSALVRVASGDFSAEVERDFRGDAVDVLAFLVNNTISELEAHVAAAGRKAGEDRERLERLVAERTRELEVLATTDTLTGVWNWRRIRELAEAERSRAERYGSPICLAMIDLDRFKPVNDRFGHDVGDEALRLVADVSRRSLRDSDRIGRLGGDEFVVIIPETALACAMVLAERIRHSVETLAIPAGNQAVSLTISIGIAEWKSPESLDSLFKRADVALYEAKRSGRNRVAPAA